MSGRYGATKLFYTQELLRKYPSFYFIFGDNAERVGKGGQAAYRDEPNMIGIATKLNCGAYFEAGNIDHMRIVIDDCRLVERLLETGHNVVMPVLNNNKPSIGTGLSGMPVHCPDLYEFICAWHKRMLEKYP